MDYEKDIINYLIENNICDEKEASDTAVMLTPKQALNAYLSWNGIIGYTDTIYQVIKDYTPRQLTFIVKYNNGKETNERVFRSHYEYRQFMDELLEQGYTQSEKTYENGGLGWIDYITCFEK